MSNKVIEKRQNKLFSKKKHVHINPIPPVILLIKHHGLTLRISQFSIENPIEAIKTSHQTAIIKKKTCKVYPKRSSS